MRTLPTLLLLLFLAQLACAATVELPVRNEMRQASTNWCSSSGSEWANSELHSYVTVPEGVRGSVSVEITATAGSRGWTPEQYYLRLFECRDEECRQSTQLQERQISCPASCGNPCGQVKFSFSIPGTAGVRHYKTKAYTGGIGNVRLLTGSSSATTWKNSPPTTPTFATPAAGALANGSLAISWSASTDPEGDSISYELERSENGGAAWIPLVARTGSRAYTLDTTALPPGEHQLRVRATDGIEPSAWQYTSFVIRGIARGEWKQAGPAEVGRLIPFSLGVSVHGNSGGMLVEVELPEGTETPRVLAPGGKEVQSKLEGQKLAWSADSDGEWKVLANCTGAVLEKQTWQAIPPTTLEQQHLRAELVVRNPTGFKLESLLLQTSCPQGLSCGGGELSLDLLGAKEEANLSFEANGDVLKEQWGGWKQDLRFTTQAGGSAFIVRELNVENALNATIENVPIPLVKTEWNCTSEIDIPAEGLVEGIGCSRMDVITREEGAWFLENGALAQKIRVYNTDLEITFNEVLVEPGVSGENSPQAKYVSLTPNQTLEVLFSLASNEAQPSAPPVESEQESLVRLKPVRNLTSVAGEADVLLPENPEPGTSEIGVFINGEPANGTVELVSPSNRTYGRELGEDGTFEFNFDEEGEWTVSYGNQSKKLKVKRESAPKSKKEENSAPSQLLGLSLLNEAPHLGPLILFVAFLSLLYLGYTRISTVRLVKNYRGGEVELALTSRRKGLKGVELTDLAPEGARVSKFSEPPVETRETIFGTLHRWHKEKLKPGEVWKVKYSLETPKGGARKLRPAEAKGSDEQDKPCKTASNEVNL